MTPTVNSDPMWSVAENQEEEHLVIDEAYVDATSFLLEAFGDDH